MFKGIDLQVFLSISQNQRVPGDFDCCTCLFLAANSQKPLRRIYVCLVIKVSEMCSPVHDMDMPLSLSLNPDPKSCLEIQNDVVLSK